MLTNLFTCYVNIQTEVLSLKVERVGGTFITQAMPPTGAKIMDFMWNGPVMVCITIQYFESIRAWNHNWCKHYIILGWIISTAWALLCLFRNKIESNIIFCYGVESLVVFAWVRALCVCSTRQKKVSPKHNGIFFLYKTTTECICSGRDSKSRYKCVAVFGKGTVMWYILNKIQPAFTLKKEI